MTIKKKNTPKISNLESAMGGLERLIEKLESPETSLEDSLEAFEAAIGLTRMAQHSLSTAEQKVRLLIESNGDPVGQPFKADKEQE